MRKNKVEAIIDEEFQEFANIQKSDSVELMLKSHSKQNIKRLVKALQEMGFKFESNGKLYPDTKTGELMFWMKNFRKSSDIPEPEENVDDLENLDDVED
jgi:hypothetical protein